MLFFIVSLKLEKVTLCKIAKNTDYHYYVSLFLELCIMSRKALMPNSSIKVRLCKCCKYKYYLVVYLLPGLLKLPLFFHYSEQIPPTLVLQHLVVIFFHFHLLHLFHHLITVIIFNPSYLKNKKYS